jgi:hypothetical protein
MLSHALRRLPCGTAMKSSRLKATATAGPLRDNVGFARLDFKPLPVSGPMRLVAHRFLDTLVTKQGK